MLLVYSLIFTVLAKLFFGFSFYYIIPLVTAIYFLSKLLLKALFGLEIAISGDAILSIETAENISYIVSCCTIKGKIDVEAIKIHIKKRAFIHPYYEKLKKIYYRNYGLCYWKKSENFNIDDHIEVVNDEFPDYDSMYVFMGNHVNNIDYKFESDKPQWKIFIVSNMAYNQGAIVFKIHHKYTDGLSLLSYLLVLGDSKEYGLVHMPKIKYYEWVYIYFMGIFDIKRIFQKFLFRN